MTFAIQQLDIMSIDSSFSQLFHSTDQFNEILIKKTYVLNFDEIELNQCLLDISLDHRQNGSF